MNYFNKKEERKIGAQRHIVSMNEKYNEKINSSFSNAEFTDENYIPKLNLTKNSKKAIIEENDSVSAILKRTGKMCVLNFSSYKVPGGMFLEGSSAQEESLCHESTLYNVLSKMNDWYDNNKKTLNRALYKNRSILAKDIVFERNGRVVNCDVLTCAAPNFRAANKYCNVSKSENSKVLEDRIKYIMSILGEKDYDYVILGAYGCGVFGQDGKEVAECFKKYQYLLNEKTVPVYAIIGDENYQKFLSVYEENND